MRVMILIIALSASLMGLSQDATQKIGIRTVTSIGFAGGESTAKPLFHLSGGLTYKKHFAGLGVGIDQYLFNSYPVYADWRMNFGKMRLGFIYLNGGYNLPGKTRQDDDEFKTTNTFNGGFFMDAGVGYRVKLSAVHRLLFSAGYSQKNMSNRVGYLNWCWAPPCLESLYTYQYKLGRVVAKMSWEFGR
ncbi:MAG: hypothetical protein H7Y42_09905 [Chitinophagaceae bacterium]|nr:hypothetical protein [Chitinophagaceae bacterium]